MLTQTTNFWEATRLILAVTGLYACLWAFLRTGVGAWTFPMPIRDQMIRRRQGQLVVFALINLALGAAAAIGAQTPETGAPSLLFYASNGAFVLTLLGLLYVTVQQAVEWEHYEEVGGHDGPPGPTVEEHARVVAERNGYRAALAAHLALLADTDLFDLPEDIARRRTHDAEHRPETGPKPPPTEAQRDV